MKNFKIILDKLVENRYRGNKDRLSVYTDFITLFLSRYENLYVSTYDESGIYIMSRNDSYTNALVTVEQNHISVEVETYPLGYGPYNESLFVRDSGFYGKMIKFVPDDSFISYSGIKSINNGEETINFGDVVDIIFTNKNIINCNGEPIYNFSNNDIVTIYSELFEYSEQLYEKIYNSFFVGEPNEFNVQNINFKYLTEEEINKLENDIKSNGNLPSNVYECYHQEILKDVNPEDIFLNNGEVIIAGRKK